MNLGGAKQGIEVDRQNNGIESVHVKADGQLLAIFWGATKGTQRKQ